MNDLISRKALIAEYDRVHVGAPGGARKLMEDAPAVDAVEVVRCKDCKHFYEINGKDSGMPCGYGQCLRPLIMPMFVKADDFCSYSERMATNEAD